MNPLVGLFAGVGVAYCVCWMRYYAEGVTPPQFFFILFVGAVCGLFAGIRSAGKPKEGRALRTAAALLALVIIGVLLNAVLF